MLNINKQEHKRLRCGTFKARCKGGKTTETEKGIRSKLKTSNEKISAESIAEVDTKGTMNVLRL
jgi:hypothetical protein